LEASLTAAAEAEIKDRAAKARSTLEKCKAGQAKALAELRNHAGAILAVMVQREGRASAGTLAVRTWNLSGARFGENAQGLQSLRAEAEGGDPLAVALVKCLNDGSLDKLPDFAADGQAAELFLQNPPTVGAVLEAWNAPTPTPAQIERAAKLDAASKRLDAARDAEKRARADLDQAEMMRGGTPGTIQRNLAAAEAEHKKAVAAVASAEAEVGGLGA
jgi:hypothetical protein